MSEPKATETDIHYAYRLLLGRTPDDGGYRHFQSLIERQDLTPMQLASGLMDSAEFVSKHPMLFRDETAVGLPPVGVLTQKCSACTQSKLESPEFRYWAMRLGERPGRLHRKVWEWCFIVQSLHERGMLNKDSCGLGFAVGTEPLTSLFASMGCNVLASDVGEEVAREAGWVETEQHASGLTQLNLRHLCSRDEFEQRVEFREVDMRAIPPGLDGFDFLWSSCALEHLGSLQNGMDFVKDAMHCLRPGGIAIHTTELNCDSDEETVETGNSVVYRRRDLIELAKQLRALGHTVEPFDFSLGETEADGFVDEAPYASPVQLKLRIGAFASTSFGLIIMAADR